MKGFNIKITNKTFLYVALILLIVVIVQQTYKYSNIEGFHDATDGRDAQDALLNTFTSVEEETPGPTQCPTPGDTPWWLTQPVGSIISRYHGTTLDVAAVVPAQNINSPYIVPIKNPSVNTPPGCLSVNTDGTYTTTLCDMNNINQHWNIVYIKNAQDFVNYVPQEEIKIDETYEFCLIISSRDNTKALHYDGGALAVRPVGNYEGQKWLISPTPTGKIFPIIESNQYSQFTPEHTPNTISGVGNLPLSQQTAQVAQDVNADQSSALTSKLDQIMNLLQTQGKMGPPSESSFGVKPIAVNIKLRGNDATNSANNSANNSSEGTELFQNIANNSTNSTNSNNKVENIPACPILNMDDYMSKTGIPCDACANF